MTRIAAWLVPTAAVALIAGGVAASASATSASPDLADRTPAQLLVAVASADVKALSGTVTTEADLGFPQLPSTGQSTASSDPMAVATRLLAGDNTVRVWVDSERGAFRAALVDQFAELDIVGDGSEVWTYSSTEDVATRYQLPDEGAADSDSSTDEDDDRPTDAPSIEGFTPDAMADRALAAIDDTTEVTVGDTQVVAGRDAYTLVVAPRTTETLVDRIEVAVDAETSFPLQVQVFARGQDDPAFSTGFSAIDYATPDAEIFDFTPPAGATVQDGEVFGMGGPDGAPEPELPQFGGTPQLLGSGWTTIVELPVPAETPAPSDEPTGDEPDPSALLDQLTQPVDGGRAVSTALLSILLTDDGRVLVGAVPVDALVAAAE